MSVGSNSYLDLVKEAYVGMLQLPAFQREWAWRAKQTATLFDSIRLKYPIGGFLFTEPNTEVTLSPRTFKHSAPQPKDRLPSRLVLDGQQRITAGIQLFYSSSSEAGDTLHFFIDVSKTESLFREYVEARSLTIEAGLDDEQVVQSFCQTLDPEDKYIVYRPASMNPYQHLAKSHLLFTPLLRPDKEKDLDTYIDGYLDIHPTKKKLVRNLIKPAFKISDATIVPHITLSSGLTTEAISRIFSTLNTTGKILTPFELVVAILYPEKIDLRDDIEIGKTLFPKHYPNMDKTGEIALQTAVLLANKDPKKSLLPRNLNRQIWQANNQNAFANLESVGAFLSDQLGFALDKSNKYIPYDSVFLPLAFAWYEAKIDELSAPERKIAYSKIKIWVIGTSLHNWYQEGVHNKQRKDASDLVSWIKGGDAQRPVWLSDVRVPSLKRIDPKGAIGKTLSCLQNTRTLRDPLSEAKIPLGDLSADDHHIFPKKFCDKLSGWNKATDTPDVALNIMRLSAETNKRFLNDDPMLQITECIKINGESKTREIFLDQWIPENCINILMKAKKTQKDFVDFIVLRESFIKDKIKSEFGFSSADSEPPEDEERLPLSESES